MTTKHIAVLGAGISGAIAARTLRDRGFAVTLSIGIACSMFTAVTVTRLMIVGYLVWRRPKTLPV